MPSSSAAASVKALEALPAWRLDCTARLILCLVKFGPPTIARIAPVCGTMLTSEDSGRTRRPLAVVQWLEQPAPGDPVTVRATAELPFRDVLEWVGEPALGELYGRWCASMMTVRRVPFGFEREWLRFKLGPPGEAHRVGDC